MMLSCRSALGVERTGTHADKNKTNGLHTCAAADATREMKEGGRHIAAAAYERAWG